MISLLNIPATVLPFIIFALRVSDMSLDTLRVLFVIRGRKPLAWILGFFQSLLWVIAITSVLSNLDTIVGQIQNKSYYNLIHLTTTIFLCREYLYEVNAI